MAGSVPIRRVLAVVALLLAGLAGFEAWYLLAR